MIKPIFLIMLIVLAISCNNKAKLTTAQVSEVQDSVKQMLESISKNVSHDGPVAWLHYFEHDPGFYMAAHGELAFPNNDSAKIFITTILVKLMPKIKLEWSDIRIDPIGAQWAGIGSFYHEDIADSSGKIRPVNGYFTALAHQTSEGWKLRNAHWSYVSH